MFSYYYTDGIVPPYIETHTVEQNVWRQGKSPRNAQGILVLRPNNLEYNRRDSTYQNISYWYPYWEKWVFLSTRNWQGLAGEPNSATQLYQYIPDLRREVENKFLEDISSIRVNLLDLYRTRKETVDMVTKNVNKLRFAYLHLKRRRWREFCSTLGFSAKVPPAHKYDNIPSLWLEYSYGWKPLVTDVYTMLNKTFEVPSSVHKSVILKEFQESGGRNIPSMNDFRSHYDASFKLRAVSRAIISVDSPAIYAASQYGLTDPAVTAWEAVPYSFIVDWFYPVGTYLDMLGGTAGLILRDFSTTCTVECNSSMTASQLKGISWDIFVSGNTVHNLKVKVRAAGYTPTYQMPPIKGPLDQSITRFSYALSLLASVFGKRK